MESVNNYDKIYDEDFFKDRNAATRYAAGKILDIVASTLPTINSAADVGCGVGTWLSVLKEQGVNDVHGFDGHWVNQDLLQIPVDAFTKSDLQKPLAAPRKFDLAISLEVAEHLPAACADTFVQSLTDLADFVLFSAAIPHQGGVNHLNEQWQSYWAEKFEAKNYLATDPVRSRIWADQKISIPYRQNIVVYIAESRMEEIDLKPKDIHSLSVAHPELYEIRNSKSVKQALSDLRSTATNKFFRMIGKK